MKKSTKLFMTGAASLLGVALATGGAYATTASLTTVDAPGQVMPVSGVGPASENALEHANPNAHGLFGWTTESTDTPEDGASGADDDAAGDEARDAAKDARDEARDSAKSARDAAKDAAKDAEDAAKGAGTKHSSSDDDGDDADENEQESDSSGSVEAVEPDDAVEVDHESDDADEAEREDE
ncbi:hypothetical protein [Cryobacterium sp. Sr8]|uniref:hypothetical protein n=1 Tax=Cryobacterium sp. Sr8 TaxID=1259203 RepID=UPI00141A9066|nr:hypothetical protein [Cryobacterium sp. Sr8]